jgi:hypothetical protein
MNKANGPVDQIKMGLVIALLATLVEYAGEKTSRMAAAIKEYNPDSGWTLVTDEGVVSAVSEK